MPPSPPLLLFSSSPLLLSSSPPPLLSCALSHALSHVLTMVPPYYGTSRGCRPRILPRLAPAPPAFPETPAEIRHDRAEPDLVFTPRHSHRTFTPVKKLLLFSFPAARPGAAPLSPRLRPISAMTTPNLTSYLHPVIHTVHSHSYVRTPIFTHMHSHSYIHARTSTHPHPHDNIHAHTFTPTRSHPCIHTRGYLFFAPFLFRPVTPREPSPPAHGEAGRDNPSPPMTPFLPSLPPPVRGGGETSPESTGGAAGEKAAFDAPPSKPYACPH